jgi:2-C-methyl-D-erythritol 4-phosphate cytidylyltransferase
MGEKMKKVKCIAIVLAGGKGKRMESDIPKQYIELNGKPILYYALNEFENCSIIDEIIEGGKERYHSVNNGLLAIDDCDYVFIHDGARPMIQNSTIMKAYECVKEFKACVVAVQTKDTIKIADEEGFISVTPNREKLWNIQTPQVFEWGIIKKAYDILMESDCNNITDDAMVVENMLNFKVKLVQGTYENIKVTTPSDLVIASAFLRQ